MPFQPKITRRSRVVVGLFSSEQMLAIGQAGLDSIRARIVRAETVEDAPAKALKPGRINKGRQYPGYPGYKSAHGLQPIRDWTLSGRTMRALQVKSASENRVVLGFIDDRADLVAHINNQRQRQFGVSPTDQQVLIEAVRSAQHSEPVARWETKIAA